MADHRNRKRPIQIKFFVDEKEQDMIKAKIAQIGITNMSAYIRKMAIEGIYPVTDRVTEKEVRHTK